MKRAHANQLHGNAGEMAFAEWLSRASVLANKQHNDYGMDFLCQLPGVKSFGKSFPMPGDVFCASVRSTEHEQSCVRINRDDADLFLQATVPMVLGIVRRSTTSSPAEVSMRPVDESFIEELAGFLGSDQKTLAVSFESGINDPANAAARMRQLVHPVKQRALGLLRDELLLQNLIKKPTIRLELTPFGSVAFIHTPDFNSQFALDSEAEQLALRNALFGKGSQLRERISRFPYKPGFLERLNRISTETLIGGPTHYTGTEPVQIELTSADRTDIFEFEYRVTDGWYAFCHSSGLSIRFSETPIEKDNQPAFDIEILFDQDVTVDDILSNRQLVEFLEFCTVDRVIRIPTMQWNFPLTDGPFISLCAKAEVVRILRKLKEAEVIDLGARTIESIDEGEFATLRVLGVAFRSSGFMKGFVIACGDVPLEKLVREKVRMWLPICGNLDKKGVVLWLAAIGDILKEADEGTICGITVDEVLEHRVDFQESPFPTAAYPELKVCPQWPGIPLDGLGPEQGPKFRGIEDWGVSLTYEKVDGE